MTVIIDGTTGITSPAETTVNLNYTGTLTGGTGVVNLGSGQVYKDASGNVGIGAIPSTSSACTNIELPYGATLSARSNTAAPQFAMMSNAVGNWYAPTYKINGFATQYTQQGFDGTHIWYTAPSGTAGNAITFTSRMVIDSSGNVGIGTSSPTCKLQVINPDVSWSTSGNMTSGSAFGYNLGGSAINIGSSSGQTWIQSAYANNSGVAVPLIFVTGASERARIDSSGNLLVGTTTVSAKCTVASSSGSDIYAAITSSTLTGYLYNSTSTTASNFAYMIKNSAEVGSIRCTTSSTAYNTSSDYRLKQDVQPMTGALAKVAALKPCTYKWKVDGSDGQGFIAHELQAVIPECVTGEKDAVNEDGSIKPQGIDTSFLVATLTAAIQEQQTLITALTARITALETA